ncbi:hypothetical protein C8A00DRAFT_40841 [Chaetomidium leptoderma]|uniref:FYVE-type domain-containing protein n=1 Tax=Chaetomidium leptoderma TaxID=669021 RepID=A0AAN6VT08_9PEZI|nr:hypothetical protein C8A00DRAFT_40841 [Chaetomidium leptoderma]
MATDFIMPRMPGEQQNLYYSPAQQQRQQFRPQQRAPFQPSPIPTGYPASTQHNSPVSPLGTPGSTSPTGSNQNHITDPNRPKLYVPAVLRPTKFPSKEPAIRPKPENDNIAAEEGLRPNGSFMSLGGLSAFGRLSRRSTGDSAKCVDDNWNGNWDLDQFPKPTGVPSRKHWKPDQESAVCDHATCKRYFSYFTRRHHCRKCGNIFCDQHSTFEIPLDQDANFNPRGEASRACGHCNVQFKEWRRLATNSKPASQDSPNGAHHDHQVDTPTTPVTASPINPNPNGLPLPTSEVAHSVPRDWNWSTF